MDYIFVKRTHVKRSSAHSKIETFVFQMRIHMQMRLKATNVRLAKKNVYNETCDRLDNRIFGEWKKICILTCNWIHDASSNLRSGWAILSRIKIFSVLFLFREKREKECLNLKRKQRLAFLNVNSTLRTEFVTRKRELRDESEKFGENRQYFGNTRL